MFLNTIRLTKCLKQFIDSIPDQYKTREICDLAVSLFPFLTVYCPNK